MKLWEKLQKISSLTYVASPILVFRPRGGKALPEKWEMGKKYALSLYAFGFIPLGKHDIAVRKIDAAGKEIATNESSSLARTWDHVIRVEKISEDAVKYTDEVEIEAGLLTMFIWLFAHIFYRHRQRKWKVLLGSLRDA